MKTPKKSFAQILADAKAGLTYHVEGAIIEFTEEICRIMEVQGVSKVELAKRLECKPAFVTKLLSGQNNFTIETMVRVARALESEIKIHLQGPGVESHWEDVENFTITGKVECANSQSTNFRSMKPVLANHQCITSNYGSNEELALAA